MSGAPDSFVGWIKRNVVSLEGECAAGRIVNLSTSGVRTSTVDRWFERTCQERLPSLMERMQATNEYGLPALTEAIRRTNRVPDDREIYLTAGASAGYRLLCDSLLAGRPGLEVLVESPTYQPLASLPARFGAQVIAVPIPLKRKTGDVAEAFVRAVRPSTTALVLSNLHNPTGSFLTRDEMNQLARRVRAVAPRITVIVDETFLGLGPEPFRTAADLDPCIATVGSLTKTFGLGQLRCGWVIADKERYPQLLDDWVQFESIGSKILEALSLMAFEQIDSLLAESLAHLEVNRAMVMAGTEQLRQAQLVDGEFSPFGCLFFPRWTGRTHLDHAATRLREEFGVLVSPGRFFSGQCADHLRLGLGGPADVVREGLERLTRGLQAIG
jgi:aspartate/methionine/tyrosine aminotransferase